MTWLTGIRRLVLSSRVTFRPMPTTTCGGRGDFGAYMPASFREPTSTSFGHLRPALDVAQPRARRRPRRRPVNRGTQPHASGGTSVARDTDRPARSATRGGADHDRPWRPRPACWNSATSTDPSIASPAAERASRSALVEPVSATMSMRCHKRAKIRSDHIGLQRRALLRGHAAQ